MVDGKLVQNNESNTLNSRKKVVLIGLDGMSWPILNRIFEYGAMPNLEQITKKSIKGVMKSTIPPNSATAWTSITSGVNPGKHGIFGFTTFNEKYETRVISSKDIFYPRIHEIVANNGLKSVCINLPMSYPINEIEGVSIITDWVAPRLTFYPDSIKKYADEYQFHSGIAVNNKQDYFERIYNGAVKRVNVINQMMKDLDWNLFFVLYSESDQIFHTSCDDVMNGNEASLRIFQKIDETFRFAKECADLTIVVSDHGFSKYKYAIFVNSLLEKMGFINKTWNRGLKDITDFEYKTPVSKIKVNETLYRFLTNVPFNTVIKRIITSILKKDVQIQIPYPDPFKSKAFVPFPYSFGIHVKEKELINDIIKEMNKKEYFKGCWKREEIYWGDQVHKAPEIMFLPNFNKGYSRGETGIPGKIILPRKNWWQHHPDGIMIIHDGKLLNQRFGHVISPFDVVPTLLKYLNISIPSYVDGIPIKEISHLY